MPYAFFYISAAVLWILVFICRRIRPLKPSHAIIAVTTAVISLIYDSILGEHMQLYHYISVEISVYYMVLGAIFIYPPANILYSLFLPKDNHSKAVYSIIWIAVMMVFEFASILAGTVVFTGWQPFPWSPVTYIATYLWVNLLFGIMERLNYTKTAA